MKFERIWKVVVCLLTASIMVGGLVATAAAEDFKPYGIRLRGLAVIPNEDADSQLASLDLEVSNDLTPELDLEYFFLPSLSTELILGVSRHEITSKGDSLGSTWLLPPTLTVKYHFVPNNMISPYLGLGVNCVIPFKEKANGINDFNISNSLGWAAQVGADVALGNSWFANVDVKYLSVETEMKIAGVKYDLDLNPVVAGLGVGYRF
ncbi:outer membrane beta-barrel protein [Desulfuromonas carbonis]|uniref:OmpW/AlkL family protein n=1 Tax=Desulfuromonas sp. DDH964 TaxID=1823759 RepID=UPI00078C6466|nr:OmpW family outer membrane protein [Desulfuromonas sp. DDH964]AMV72432.1 Outer membrane protein W precursor [Desulfuromonas sp. DDH964]